MPRIRKLKLSGFKKVYRTYLMRDFPRTELRPLFSVQRAWKRGEYSAYIYEEKGEILAYAAFSACGDPFCLLDYFAVTEKFRRQGIGSAFLKDLLPVVLPKSEIIVEAESTQSANNSKEAFIRQKRLDFYEKNGAIQTGVGSRVFGVDYTILCFPGKAKILSVDEYQHAILHLYRKVYHPFFGKIFATIQSKNQP